MKYFVAKSYENAEWIGEPFENEKGKMVVKIKTVCPRCGGSGSYSYNSLDGTMCYGCHGRGVVIDTVRAYTEKERAAMDRAAARRVEKKAQEEQAKLDANIANRGALMLKFYEKNGFNEEGKTYVVLGNSYDIKDELKAAGFKYDPVLKWHGPSAAGYNVVEFNFSDLYTWNDRFGVGNYVESVYEVVAEKVKSAEFFTSSGDFIGELKERLRNLNVVLKSRFSVSTRFGDSECLKFDDEKGNHFCWWTSTCPQAEIGEKFLLTGTVKEHTTYKAENLNVLTRCKLEGAA